MKPSSHGLTLFNSVPIASRTTMMLQTLTLKSNQVIWNPVLTVLLVVHRRARQRPPSSASPSRPSTTSRTHRPQRVSRPPPDSNMPLRPPLFTLPLSVKSSLIKKTPDSIPPVHELELLRDELEELKRLSLARAKKAADDLHAIDESMRRMREKEKGKARAMDKVKRERDCTCFPQNASL
jgi:hypothetical protein